MSGTKPLTTFFWATRTAWVGFAIAAWVCRGELIALVEHANEVNILMRVFTYSVVYVTLAGLNVPGTVLLTVLAGPLFGTNVGTIVASFVSTLGASLAFVANRHFMSSFPPKTDRIVTTSPTLPNKIHWSGWNPARIGAYVLLFMRLVPVVPFFVVNVLAGRSRLSVGMFWLVSQLGMLPATVLLVHGGAVLTNP